MEPGLIGGLTIPTLSGYGIYMNTHTQQITEHEATQTGALAGHTICCTCGDTQRTSAGLGDAQIMARKHADWHESKR